LKEDLPNQYPAGFQEEEEGEEEEVEEEGGERVQKTTSWESPVKKK